MGIKKSRIQRKTIVAISIAVLSFMLGLYYSTYLTIFKNIEKIEYDESKKTAFRLFNVLNKELEYLTVITKDYSIWDLTYDFINNGDTNYVADNLSLDMMRNLKLDYCAFFDNQNKMVYNGNINFFEPERQQLLQKIPLIINKYLDKNNKIKVGIIKLKNYNYPLLLVTAKVFRSNNSGLSNGSVTFVRILDQRKLESLSAYMQNHLIFNFDKNAIFTTQDSIIINQEDNYQDIFIGIRDINKELGAVINIKKKSIVNSESRKHSLIIVLLFLTGGIIIITIIAFYIKNTIMKRLTTVSKAISSIGDNYQSSIHLAEDEEDDFFVLSRAFNQMIHRIQVAETNLADRIDLIKNILDNAEQGFLLFGDDGNIWEGYSAQCVKFFQTYPENQPFYKLLFPKDSEQQEFLAKIINRILNEEDRKKIDIYLSLLPSELPLYQRTIGIKYKVLNDLKTTKKIMMVIMTDLTSQKQIESEVTKEQQTLKMVVKVVVDYNDFMSLIGEYRHFVLFRIFEILRDESVIIVVKVTEIIRQIHTFKGNFGQFDMFNIYNKLNQLETDYFAEIDNLKKSDSFTLLNFMSHYNLLEWLDDEMIILKQTLGENYFAQGHRYWITRDKLDEIENKILAYLPIYKYRTILPDLKKIMYNPFKDMFNYHINYLTYLSNSQNKPLKDVKIEGGDFLVDTVIYNPLIKSLVHIFRNSIDHGIETQEERINSGKDEVAQIKIKLEQLEHNLLIKISDDGRGIDINKIKNKAIEKNILSRNTADKMPAEELINIIFSPEFSTSEKLSELSGRGMGLSAVKEEVDKLDGKIEVNTIVGQETTFAIYLPLEIDYSRKSYNITIFDIMNRLIKEVKKTLEKDIKVSVDTKNEINLHRAPHLIINRYSAVISIYGIVKGNFTVSADSSLTELIASYFLGADNELIKKDKYRESSIAEFTNVVIGKTVKEFSDFEKILNFNSPYTILSEKTVIKYLDSQVWNCDIATENGSLNINMIINDK